MKTSFSHRRCHSGFTLIETLMALALSSVLLVVVFRLTDSTVQYHIAGNDQVLASQRLLGLLQDLRLDIRSVPVDPHWQAAPSVLNDDSLPAIEASRITSQIQLADMEKTADPIRLAGDSRWLLLTLGKANPRWPGDANQAQQVVWSIGNSGRITVPTHEVNGRLTNVSIPLDSAVGLTRSRVNGSVKPITPEPVVSAQEAGFRYLADGRWRSSWNSSMEQRLPDAIEVRLTFPGEATQRVWTIQTASIPTRERTTR